MATAKTVSWKQGHTWSSCLICGRLPTAPLRDPFPATSERVRYDTILEPTLSPMSSPTSPKSYRTLQSMHSQWCLGNHPLPNLFNSLLLLQTCLRSLIILLLLVCARSSHQIHLQRPNPPRLLAKLPPQHEAQISHNTNIARQKLIIRKYGNKRSVSAEDQYNRRDEERSVSTVWLERCAVR